MCPFECLVTENLELAIYYEIKPMQYTDFSSVIKNCKCSVEKA